MKYEFVETELDGKIELLIVKAFCYGITAGETKIMLDPATNKYVIGFEIGEDALNFKVKELDKVLLELIDEDKNSKQKDLFNLPKQNPNTINISPNPYITYTTDTANITNTNWSLLNSVTGKTVIT